MELDCGSCRCPIMPGQRAIQIAYGIGHETALFTKVDGAPAKQHFHYDCANWYGLLEDWRVLL